MLKIIHSKTKKVAVRDFTEFDYSEREINALWNAGYRFYIGKGVTYNRKDKFIKKADLLKMAK